MIAAAIKIPHPLPPSSFCKDGRTSASLIPGIHRQLRRISNGLPRWSVNMTIVFKDTAATAIPNHFQNERSALMKKPHICYLPRWFQRTTYIAASSSLW